MAFQQTAFLPAAFAKDPDAVFYQPTFQFGAFQGTAFSVGVPTGLQAFEALAFEAKAFPVGPTSAVPAFSEIGFDPIGFYAGADPTVEQTAAFDGNAFSQSGFFATANPALPEAPLSPFRFDAAISNLPLSSAPIASGLPGGVFTLLYPPGYIFINSGHRASGLELPYLALVRRADPDFERNRRNEVEYEFTRQTFRANPEERGAYGAGVNSTAPGNSYPGVWDAP